MDDKKIAGGCVTGDFTTSGGYYRNEFSNGGVGFESIHSVSYKSKIVNPAVSGATRKIGIVK